MTHSPRSPYKPRHPVRIPHGRWPDSLVGLTEAATVVGMTPRGLQKLLDRGGGPLPEPGAYVWSGGRLWRVWRLVSWRHARHGGGPTDGCEIWEAWRRGDYGVPSPVRRPDPKLRHRLWHRGEPRWRSKVRIRKQMNAFRLRLERLIYEEKMIELRMKHKGFFDGK